MKTRPSTESVNVGPASYPRLNPYFLSIIQYVTRYVAIPAETDVSNSRLEWRD